MGAWSSKQSPHDTASVGRELSVYPENGKKLRMDATVEEVYHLGRTLGQGAFSKVKLATHRATGEQVACKVMRLPRPMRCEECRACTARGLIMKEIDVLLDLDHPSVVSMREYFVHRNRVYLIMDLLRGGELLDALINKGHYSEADARTIFQQLIRGVQHLHSRGIVHRDIKLDNLLLARPGDITSLKIADFGFAKKHPRAADELSVMKTMLGTPEYMAPEVILAHPDLGSAAYGPAVDLWSCGVVLYMLLSGVPPFFHASEVQLLRRIVKGQYDFEGPEWRHVSRQARHLVSRLLVVDPAKRLTCQQVLEHPWMRGAGATPRPLLHTAARMQSGALEKRGGQAPLQERIADAITAAAAGEDLLSSAEMSSSI